MFVKYDEILYPYLCTSNLCEWKLSFFCNVLDKTVTELFACQQVSIPCDISPSTFKLLAIKYLKVSMKELKFKLQSQENLRKSAAHRKEILMDKSLVDPCAPPAKQTRVCATQLLNETASTSTANVEEDEDGEWLCSGCNVSWASTSKLQWIECTSCRKWTHRKCDKSLRSHKLWRRLKTTDDPYTCPLCQWIAQLQCFITCVSIQPTLIMTLPHFLGFYYWFHAYDLLVPASVFPSCMHSGIELSAWLALLFLDINVCPNMILGRLSLWKQIHDGLREYDI